jgi:hypothetical protein
MPSATSRKLHHMGSILTWIWYPIAFLPLPVLVAETARGITNNSVDWSHKLGTIVCCLLTVIYLGRWAVGNLTYLEEAYRLTSPWISCLSSLTNVELHQRIALRFVWDLFLLGIHGALLVWMALTINHTLHFGIGLVALLYSDLFWLLYERRVWPHFCLVLIAVRQQLRENQSDGGDSIRVHVPSKSGYFPRTWMWTNVATATSLSGALLVAAIVGVADNPITLMSLLTAGAVNSYLDIHHTHLGL